MIGFDVDDTIAAIASPPGGGFRGIIRISGPECLQCLRQSFTFYPSRSSTEATAELLSPDSLKNQRRPFSVPVSIELVGENPSSINLPGELLVWPSTQSYTRQPSAEFHTFGSPPLLAKALKQICHQGARLANPGEFTLRAFLSGRLDLTQAEAVLSIIDAQADTQLSVALRQLAGGLSHPLAQAREHLTFLLAEIEAGLDFVEEDIVFLTSSEITARLQIVKNQLDQIIAQINSRDLVAHHLKLALIGLPNSGKSTLFNELLGRRRALVSDLSGTTTDFLVEPINLEGILVELIDTAGIELIAEAVGNGNPVSNLAQQQRERIEAQADLRLLCLDRSRPLSAWEQDQLIRLQNESAPESVTLVVLTKSDLVTNSPAQISPSIKRLGDVHGSCDDQKLAMGCFTDSQYLPPGPLALPCGQESFETMLLQLDSDKRLVAVEVPSRDHLSHLREMLRFHIVQIMEARLEMVGSTLIRTCEALRAAGDSVKLALETAHNGWGDEIVAAELRNALDGLGQVVGTVYTDDILDVVFSRFCIGK